jgi:hypothetical protein
VIEIASEGDAAVIRSKFAEAAPDQALVLDVLQASPGICVAVDGAE